MALSETLWLENAHARIEVQSLGAMIRNAEFHLSGGTIVSPFFRASWRDNDDARRQDLPPILRNLGAEWPCVPFGGPGVRDDLPADWNVDPHVADWDGHPHGLCSNSEWRLTRLTKDRLRAEIDYPAATPIERLVREIGLHPDRPELQLRLSVHARRAGRVPVGLHPVFDLAGLEAGAARLELPFGARAWTFPVDVEPGQSRFLADQRDTDPEKLATSVGPSDLARLPFDTATEDLVLLTHLSGVIALSVPTLGYRARVNWDRSKLPNCLLWFSMGGRQGYPWNGVTRAIGIEPAAAAFDLGLAHSLSGQTPLANSGVTSAIELSPDNPWSIDYSISLDDLYG